MDYIGAALGLYGGYIGHIDRSYVGVIYTDGHRPGGTSRSHIAFLRTSH